MTTLEMQSPQPSRAIVWTGWAMSGFIILFLAFDCAIKLLQLDMVKTSMTQLGYPAGHGLIIGIVETICLVLYVWPRTAILGAILLTAVYGGAIASHMRLDDPLFSHVLFGVYLGLLTWGGLYFRDPKLRALIPLRG